MNRKSIVGISFLFIVVLIFFRSVLINGKVPIPTDTLVNLFHPYRDYFSSTNPRGVPYKNPLVADPVVQLIPWKTLSLSKLEHFELPLWNPYQMAGYPLLGNIQSSPFYPLNIVMVIFPFLQGWSVFIIIQQLLASLFMFLYLRNKKLSEEASTLGALCFAFSGFFISWLEWGTIVHTALWLPLALLAVDKLLEAGKLRWNIVLSLCFIFSFLGGHLQTFIYSQGVIVVYILYHFWMQRKERKFILSCLISLMFGGIVILPVIVPQVQLLLLSARNVDQSYQQPGWFIPLAQAIQFIAPDFFGNPATGNYWGVWNYGEFIGYIGIFPLLLAFFAMLHFKKKKFFFGWFCWFSLCLWHLRHLLRKYPITLQFRFYHQLSRHA